MLEIRGDRLYIETRTLTAVMERGHLVSLARRSDGETFIAPSSIAEIPSLELVYRYSDNAPVDTGRDLQVTLVRRSPVQVDIRLDGWDGIGVIGVSEDVDTGDLIITPAVSSTRPGLLSCRWRLGGVRDDLRLVAPIYQGIGLPLDDPLIAGSQWSWPKMWEAGLAILQGNDGGVSVHTEDFRQYKRLRVGLPGDPHALGFETEAFGPVDDNLAAGGLSWRINVFEGDWRVPAARYRAHLRAALPRSPRAPWVGDIRFALSWCPTDPALLEALAAQLDPRTVLLHVSHWRTDPYDENYPTYVPSAEARAFFAKGRAMGFHMVPHGNAVDMDPTHPVYALVGDFAYRDVQNGKVDGWAYDEAVLPPPNGPGALTRNRWRKAMVKIHPGLSLWRSLLCQALGQVVTELDVDAIFIDVTLCSQNLRNCLVENMTSTEGMARLIAEVAALRPELAVGGEGLNEITMQGLSFAQAHLFRFWELDEEKIARVSGYPLNAFLFDGYCRTIGYTDLDGGDALSVARMRLHTALGAIPTATVRGAQEIAEPNAGVREMLALARA